MEKKGYNNDHIVVTHTRHSNTDTHTNIYIVSATARQPTRPYTPSPVTFFSPSSEWVPFYFNFLFISEANPRGTRWCRRPTSSASTLRLISEIASAPQNRTPRDKRRVSHLHTTTDEGLQCI